MSVQVCTTPSATCCTLGYYLATFTPERLFETEKNVTHLIRSIQMALPKQKWHQQHSSEGQRQNDKTTQDDSHYQGIVSRWTYITDKTQNLILHVTDLENWIKINRWSLKIRWKSSRHFCVKVRSWHLPRENDAYSCVLEVQGTKFVTHFKGNY